MLDSHASTDIGTRQHHAIVKTDPQLVNCSLIVQHSHRVGKGIIRAEAIFAVSYVFGMQATLITPAWPVGLRKQAKLRIIRITPKSV